MANNDVTFVVFEVEVVHGRFCAEKARAREAQRVEDVNERRGKVQIWRQMTIGKGRFGGKDEKSF